MLFNAFMIVILCIAFLITIVGMLYVLRVELNLFFEIDFVQKMREWLHVHTKKD